jgi:hypothetical protein
MEAKALQPLSEGRVVRVLVSKKGITEQRSARVVRAWSDTRANLVVDLDGPNDLGVVIAGRVNDDKDHTTFWMENVELVDGLDAAAARPTDRVCFWPPGAPSAKKIDRTDPATDPLLRGGGHIPPGAQCDLGGPGQVKDELPPTPMQRPPGHSGR